MQFSILSLLALPLAAFAQTTPTAASVSFDPTYDNPALDLLTTSCSDGANGLVTKGFKTAQELPSYPRVGGAFSIPSWNSPNCGKCYGIEFEGVTIFVTAIDTATNGFNLSKQAMNILTNGRAEEVGRVNANYYEAPAANCFP